MQELVIQAFSDQGRKVAELVADLRSMVEHGLGLSLVATDAGEVTGHVMFTRCWLDAPKKLVDVQVLSPLAVSPQHQHRGVGSQLVQRGIDAMAANGVPVVFLEGDPGYYRRFGFVPGGDHGFRRPSLRIPDAGFQAIKLPSYEPWMTGTLVYSEIFWRHDAVGLRGREPSGDVRS